MCVATLSVSGWVVDHNELTGCGLGINVANNSQTTNNYIHDNSGNGMGGTYAVGATVLNNEIAHNNTSHSSIDVGGAGVKMFDAQNVTFSGNYVHDNYGAGYWCDTDCDGVTVSKNTLANNVGSGIFYEVSCNATITNNTVTGNATYGSGADWGRGQIFAAASPNVAVYGNTVSGSNGIRASEETRTDQPQSHCNPGGTWYLRNFSVHDNTVTVTGGQNGIVENNGDAGVYAGSNSYQNDSYLNSSGCLCWTWNNNGLDWSSWKGAGQDSTGSAS
jgi:parallel beta-helix repeat protein